MGKYPAGGDNHDSLQEERRPRHTTDDQHTERDSSRDTAMRRRYTNRRAVEIWPGDNNDCGKSQPFVITSRSFPMSVGCYQSLGTYNGEAMYSPSRGNGPSKYVVGATEAYNEDPYDVIYSATIVVSPPRPF